MIKFYGREMKNLSRILTVILCCAPVFANGAGPVATTAGSNLTAYNPSTAYNNQWATVSNGRYDTDNTVKVNFGNCNAVILRCAQPKCGGGCSDASVAGPIVAGCVKSNEKCKQYGDELINFMTAQLVANSNEKIQEQQMALEQAKIQAEAQAAAAAASNAQNEQMISQMQNQMMQMQQQMAQQQEESNRQLQEALAQQAAQSAAALESMKTAATEAAKENESGITSYQQEAINRGISTDVIERQKITGQIMTEIENADLKLKAVKTAMQNSFDYAKCDARGNNCGVPRRIKKWRELATGFLEPYDEAIGKIYLALTTAQGAGVDLSQIYMMLSDSCNSWGQYLCQKADYIDYGNGKSIPRSCYKDYSCLENCGPYSTEDRTTDYTNKACVQKCNYKNCQPCTLLKMLNADAEVYEGWINPTADEETNGTVVACASNALDSVPLFDRLAKNKNGAGLVNMEELEHWLEQVEPSTAKGSEDCSSCDGDDRTKCGMCYCGIEDVVVLEQAVSKKSVKNLTKSLCVKELGNINNKDEAGECTYINPVFGICDTHPYNANIKATEYTNDGKTIKTSEQEKMNQIIGLKITVVSQQMYKQYEYLRATLQRFKIQLQKAVLTANLEAAGAKSEDGSVSSSGGLLGGNKTSQYRDCSGKNMQGTLDCLRENYSALSSQINNKKCNKTEKTQLTKDIDIINAILDSDVPECKNPSNVTACKDCLSNYNVGLIKMDRMISDDEAKRRGYVRW